MNSYNKNHAPNKINNRRGSKALLFLGLKHVIFFAVLLLTVKVYSQEINTSVAADFNSVFSLLEKNRIPNDILIDYGFDFIDIDQFNGLLQANNYISIGNYKELYNTLASSITATGIPGIADPAQEYTEWANLQKQANNNGMTTSTASIVLSGLLYNYSQINSNALANNKIQVVSGKYDDKYINGVWQNPYDSKTTFAIATPAISIHKAHVSVSLPSTLWHTNASVTNIDINFGNGSTYFSLNNESIASTTYTAVGDYTWTFRVQLTNGQYKYCRQKVKIANLINIIPWANKQ